LRENCGQQRDIGAFVIGVVSGAPEGALQSMRVAELIFGLPNGAPKDLGIELQYFAELEIEVAAFRPPTSLTCGRDPPRSGEPGRPL
jgi:hypothetical protein